MRRHSLEEEEEEIISNSERKRREMSEFAEQRNKRAEIEKKAKEMRAEMDKKVNEMRAMDRESRVAEEDSEKSEYEKKVKKELARIKAEKEFDERNPNVSQAQRLERERRREIERRVLQASSPSFRDEYEAKRTEAETAPRTKPSL